MVIQYLKQIGKMKKLGKWVPYELTKNSCFEVLSPFILHNNNEPFIDWIVTYMTTSDGQICTKKMGHGHWWSAASLIHYSILNPGKTITSEKKAQKINEMH